MRRDGGKRVAAGALLLLLAAAGPAGADAKEAAPAARIVSLAPHATELLFSAGAGAHIVGTVQWSDFPEAARAIPRVGDTANLDLETIVALRPDLVVGWGGGNSPAALERLRALGLPLYLSDPATLDDIARDIERLGALAGTAAQAARAAAAFRARLDALETRYRGREPLRVFYQVWHEPTYTVGGTHLISRVIELCGGSNVFARLAALSPQVGIEAVLAADPEVIIGSGADENPPPWLSAWQRWPQLAAVRLGQVHHLPPELIQRQTARMLDGAALVCDLLDQARAQAGK